MTGILISHYVHPNSITIITCLSEDADFYPQLQFRNENESLFMCYSEWQNIYKSIKEKQLCNNKQYFNFPFYTFLHCDKRCSDEFVILLVDALKLFAHCVDARLKMLHYERIKAYKFILKIECIFEKCYIPIENISSVLYYYADSLSLVEMELVTLCIDYFTKCYLRFQL